jgi:hypothetical protein
MNSTAFWSAMLGAAIPSIMTAVVSVYLTWGLNKSLERIKSDLQRDVFRFSKWHEKRVEAVNPPVCVPTESPKRQRR